MGASAAEISEQLELIPGIERLVPALEGLPRTYLVGGAVRDLLRGAESVDLDLAVEGDALAAAQALAERLGGESVEHERFGTATVHAEGLAFDLAATRSEHYPDPGALPIVEAASLTDDLGRRDFTINAMAVALGRDELGTLHDPHGGRADLEVKRVRVLHDQSFVDDPTRLLRAVRYEIRLGFALDEAGEALARSAAAAGALGTVSGSRVRDELLDLLTEHDVAAAAARLADLGLDVALDPHLSADPALVAGATLGAAETGADRVLTALAALVNGAPEELDPWLTRLDLKAPQRDAVARAAHNASGLAQKLREPLADSELHALLAGEPPEALALALGLGASGAPVLRFVAQLRDARLDIGGDDLVAAGIPPSPAIGAALAETLRRKLDGAVEGRDAELELALRLAREHEAEAE